MKFNDKETKKTAVVNEATRQIKQLQAGYNPATGVFNDSLRGNYLWTNSNLGEAFPDVMTPLTWSLIQIYGEEVNPLALPGNHPMFGNIGGRLYMNMSLFNSMIRTLGFSQARVNKESEEFFGHLPDNVNIPIVPFSRWQLIRTVVPSLPNIIRQRRKTLAKLPTFAAQNPVQLDQFKQQTSAATSSLELTSLWRETLEPYFREACRMLKDGTTRYENAYRPLRRKLQEQVGEADAITLLSGVSNDNQQLSSLEPVVGLWQVANGKLSREEYIRQFGHRGPHEMELFIPRSAEDPAWLDKQIANLENTDVPALLAAQEAKKEITFNDYAQRFPKDAAKLQEKLTETAVYARGRESIRSEFTRIMYLMRQFALRAGKLSGLDNDVFFLSIEDLGNLLVGKTVPTISEIPARRDAYETLSALPPYPAIINGRFDPISWAEDLNHRSDIFEAHPKPASQPITDKNVSGFPGSSGVIEGVVRVLHSLEDSNQLQPGEVLVTVTTNIGWTPVFPRVSAVVTDVGAPLSHAAIVARELGIPAVVGCGDATMRLKTGNRVRVDGGQGIITLL